MSFLNRLKRYMRNEQRTNDSRRGLSDYINEMYNDRVVQYVMQPPIMTRWQNSTSSTATWTYINNQARTMNQIGDIADYVYPNSHYIHYLWRRIWIVCDIPWFFTINVERLLDRLWFNLYVDIVNWNHQTIERIKLFLWDNEMYEAWWRLKEYIYLSELMKKIKRSNPLSKHLSDIDKVIFEIWIYAT